ncbi:hypothetical protein SEPCBS119000_002122 [Sporothrix epigloea]|uniref:Uncharacterized protein n=1 Tax=Sporothrix epigloea TaxID=1892477 RepID=A0ABP0DEF8_9PEZI
MAEGNDEPKNPFIRWKQHVDAHIGTTLHGLLGIPNMVSKNFDIRPEANSGAVSAPTGGASPSSSANAHAPSSSQANASSSSSTSHSNRDSSFPSPTDPPNSGDGLDSVDANQLLAWHNFVYYSPYSPLELQRQQHLRMLPPPVPQGVPFGADPFAFNYVDVFEDLLRCSSGRPLLDLADRSYRNVCRQMRYGNAFEPPYSFLHRMHSQSLVDAYFPRTLEAESGKVAVKSDTVNTLNDNTLNDNDLHSVLDLVEQHQEPWQEPSPKAESEWQRNDSSGSLFGELDRVFRVLGRIIDEDTGAATERTQNDVRPKSSSNLDKSEADAEDELYNAMRSAYSNAERSLASLIKTFSGHFDSSHHHANSLPFPSTSSSSSTSFSSSSTSADILAHPPDSSQGETVQTTEEHVDVFGNRHVKIVVQRLDADGNEIARETRYTIRSQSAQQAAAAQRNTKADSDDTNDKTSSPSELSCGEKNESVSPPSVSDGGTSKGSGWFWK